jgi:DNA-binding transcriptional ArsR family regulator
MANAADMMTALGDPTRRAIFDRLSDGPRPVGELAGELPVSRPAVSQHLKVLKGVGLVVDRQAGTRRLYQVDPAGLAILRSYLDGFWERSLAAFEAAANEEGEHDGGDD